MKKIQHFVDHIFQKGKYLEMRKTGTTEYVAHIHATGTVVIIGLTHEGKILLLEQYRPAVERLIIELPGGLAGDEPGTANEALDEAAARELLEETGYTTDKITRLAEGPSSAGLTNEIVTFYLAEGVSKASTVEEEHYRIVHEVPVMRLDHWLKEKQSQGMMIDYRIYAGLYLIRGSWISQ